jgi:polysaccharide deacetylase 2 family uncharacterized protein YibQ
MTEHPQTHTMPEGRSFRKGRVYRIRFYQIVSFLGAVLALGLFLLFLVPEPSGIGGMEIPRRAPAATASIGKLRPARADAPAAVRTTPSADPLRFERPPRRPAPGARAALIIDDVGLDLNLVKRAARLRYPITFSVLPHKKYSTESAEYLHEMGYEILLHLPMEPEEYPKVDPGEGAILLSMTASEIGRTIDGDLRSVPHASGVNNHMGSRATQIPWVMNDVLSALKSRRLFFIDSVTHPRSVAFRLARSSRVPSCERTIFLDHEKELARIEDQFSRFRRMAREREYTLAIGHLNPVTLAVMERRLPSLEADGVTLVFASRLASLPEPVGTPAIRIVKSVKPAKPARPVKTVETLERLSGQGDY